jgi:hypothetical protein
MYIAQKILKSMSSITNEINEDNDDFDDLTLTPKSPLISSILSPSISDRQPSLTPPTDENFTIDASSEASQESETNTTNSNTLITK